MNARDGRSLALAAICACVFGQAAHSDRPASASRPSLTGLSGLIRVPSADVSPHTMGTVAWTSAMNPADTSIGAQSTRSFGFAPAPRTEISLSLGRYVQSSGDIGWDLIIHGKAQVATQNGWRPAIAVGAADVGKNRARTGTRFVVGTWRLDNARLGATLGAAEGNHDGLLAGMQWRPIPALELQAEYDSSRVNVGLVANLDERTFVRVADLSTGTAATIGYAFALNGPPAPQSSALPRVAARTSGPALTAIRDELVALGLEDVQVRIEQTAQGQRRLVGSFENRRYTLIEQDCLPDVLAVLDRGAGEATELAVRFLRRGITVAECRVPVEAYRRYAAGKMSGAEMRARAHIALLPGREASADVEEASETANPSAGHTDVMIGPNLVTQIGTEQGEFKYGLYIRPEAAIPLGRGLLAQGAWQAPITGELVDNEPKRWTTYRTVLSYALSPAPGWLAQAVVGRCPGANNVAVLEALRPVSGRSFFRVTGGYVSSDLIRRRLYAVGEYWHLMPEWDGQIRVVGGRYVSGDTGVGLDVIRQFGATEIGVGRRISSSYNLALLRLSVPLSPRKQPQRPSALRIRPADRFTHTVRTLAEKSNYVHLISRTSVELDLAPNLRDTYLNGGRLMGDSRFWFER